MQSAVLQAGHQIPHFEVTTVDGRRVRYAEVWQRHNLVLLAIPPSAGRGANEYREQLSARLSALTPADTAVVACETTAESIPDPALIICDRWGEIAYVQALSADVATWPTADDVLEWVKYIQMQCPECPP